MLALRLPPIHECTDNCSRGVVDLVHRHVNISLEPAVSAVIRVQITAEDGGLQLQWRPFTG